MDQPVRIFISSPSDVISERAACLRAIALLNRRYEGILRLEGVFWEHQFFPSTADFQAWINEQVPPWECDVVVCILWSRIGSPLSDAWPRRADGTAYESGTVAEFELTLPRAAAGPSPDLFTFVKTAPPPGGNSAIDLRRAADAKAVVEQFVHRWFHQADAMAVPGVTAPVHPFTAGFNPFANTEAFEELFVQFLEWWLRDKGRISRPLIWDILRQGLPYVGLVPFGLSHSAVFFGRDAERRAARRLLVDAASEGLPYLLVVGSSGVGKSSLVRAGLVGDLCIDTPQEAWATAVLLAGTDPLARLADALFSSGCALLPHLAGSFFPDAARLAPALADPTVACTMIEGALDALAAAQSAANGWQNRPKARLVFVLDQAEALLDAEAEAQARLVATLTALAATGRVWIAATLRLDRMDALLGAPALAPLVTRDLRGRGAEGAELKLVAPDEAATRDIIEAPAAAAGLAFEDRDGRSLAQQMRAEVAGQPDALPLLQHLLVRLFQNSKIACWADYEAIGRLPGAIAAAADAALGMVGDAAQTELRPLLLALTADIGEDGSVTARPTDQAAFASTPARTALVEALTRERLLAIDERGQLRVAHEAFLRAWPRARDILASDADFISLRDRLSHAAADSRKDGTVLHPGPLLASAEQIVDRLREEGSAALAAYVVASIAAERRARRRRTMTLSVVTAIFAALALGAGWAGLTASRQTTLALASAALADREAAHATQSAAAADRAAETARAREAEAHERLADAQRAQSRLLADRAARADTSDERLLTALAALPDRLTAPERAYAPEALSAAVLAARSDPLRTVFSQHTDRINDITFAQDGTRILTASSDKTAFIGNVGSGAAIDIRQFEYSVDRVISSPKASRAALISGRGLYLWDLSGDYAARVLPASEDVAHNGVYAAAFSPDGHQVAAGVADGSIRVWDATTGTIRFTAKGHDGPVQSIAFSPDGSVILSGSDDGTARLWSAVDGRAGAKFHPGGAVKAAFIAGGDRVVTFSATAEKEVLETHYDIQVWRSRDGASIRKRSIQDAAVPPFVTPSPTVGRIFIASGSGAVLWDPDSDAVTARFEGLSSRVTAAVFSPDGKHLLTGSFDHNAFLWDAATGKIEDKIVHAGIISTVAFAPNSRTFATAGEGDNLVMIWTVPHDGASTRLGQDHLAVTAATFSPDGRRVATMSSDGAGRIWDASGNLLGLLPGPEKWGQDITFSPDGLLVATVSDDGAARLWDSRTLALRATLSGHTDWVWRAVFTPDGTKLATISRDRTARIWDTATGKLLQVLSGHAGWLLNIAFDAQGRRAVTASVDGTARIWDVATGRTLAIIKGYPDSVSNAVFSPDGTMVALPGPNNSAIVWDVASARQSFSLEGHGAAIQDVSFSPDSRLLVTASNDSTAKIWDVASHRVITTLSGHREGVVAAKFSSDGSRVLTTGGDDTARLWDTATGATLLVFRSPGAINQAVLDPTGSRAAVSGEDGAALWSASSPDPAVLVDWARAISVKQLSSVGRADAGLPPVPPDVWDGITLNACDELAGSPLDPGRHAPGVRYDHISTNRATERACRIAISLAPQEPRFHYELSRFYAHQFQNNSDDAEARLGLAAELEIAAKAGYGPALQNQAVNAFAGTGRPKDAVEAARLFRAAIAAGAGCAATELADMLWQGDGLQQNRDEARQLIAAAVDRGLPCAHEWIGKNLENQPDEPDALQRALFHWAVAERLNEALGDTYGRDEAHIHRIVLARRLPIEVVAKTWTAAENRFKADLQKCIPPAVALARSGQQPGSQQAPTEEGADERSLREELRGVARPPTEPGDSPARLGRLHARLGQVLRRQGRDREAISEFDAAEAALANQDGNDSSIVLADTLLAHGRVLLSIGDLAAARSQFEAAIALAQRSAQASPVHWAGVLSVARSDLGATLLAMRDLQAAEPVLREAVVNPGAMIGNGIAMADLQHDLATAHDRLGEVLLGLNKTDESIQEFLTALSLMEQLTNRNASIPGLDEDTARIRDHIQAQRLKLEHFNIGLVVNARGKLLLVYDAPFQLEPQSIVYHIDRRQIDVLLGVAFHYLIDWTASAAMHELLMTTEKVLMIRMKDKKPVEGWDVSVLRARNGSTVP